MRNDLTKLVHHLAEALHAIFAKLCQTAHSLFWRFYFVGMAFRKELIGVADDLFFERFGQEILVGKGQLLLYNLAPRYSCASMAFANTCMLFVTQLTQELGAYDAVTDVWLVAVTIDSSGITAKDADVVKHGCFLQEIAIEL